MSQNYIYMDYQDAFRKAQQLENLADRLGRISSSDIEKAITDIQNGWNGNSARRFLQKSELLQKKVEGHARALRNAAQELRNMARRYQIIEESAKTIFGNKR